MGSTNITLPSAFSSDLILVPATPEEYIECVRLNSTAWKGPLSQELYVEREKHLLSQNLTDNGSQTCWVLVDRNGLAGCRVIFAACESFRKRAFFAHDGRVEDVLSHAIGSVYVRSEFRGKGYAGRMMEELGKKLETWQAGNELRKKSLFSILFSDIGKTFYARFGWIPFKSSHITLSPMSPNEVKNRVSLPAARPMSAEDVKESMCSDIAIRKQRELLRVASEKCPGVKVAVVPNYEHMTWHWAREEFYARHNILNKPLPAVKGAGIDSQNVYCTWTRTVGETPNSRTLHILRWMYDEPKSPAEEKATVEAIAAVIQRAQLEAYEWEMRDVQFWNPTPLLEQAARMLDPIISIENRDESSIASLKWNGREVGLSSDVEWMFNEKYAWC
jgi:GNAT superfamily N-acetyltransferase